MTTTQEPDIATYVIYVTVLVFSTLNGFTKKPKSVSDSHIEAWLETNIKRIYKFIYLPVVPTKSTNAGMDR